MTRKESSRWSRQAYVQKVVFQIVDREALSAIYSDPGKFYAADPYTFLFASLMILIFGSGLFAVDTLVAKRLKAVE